MPRRPVLLALLLALALGCDSGENGGGGNGSGRPSGGGGSDPAVQEGELVINNVTEPQTLDPGRMQGVPEHRLAMALFEGLCRYDPHTSDGLPGVAERWEISEDGRTYTFHLRANAEWSDGHPVTAEDYRYSWLRVIAPGFPTQYAELIWKFVEGAEDFNKGQNRDPNSVGVVAVDEHTLRVTLKAPTPFFPQLLCHMTYFPVPRWSVEAHGDDWTKPENIACNGPYTLADRRVNRFVLMEKNPRYWNRDQIAIERVRWLPVTDLVAGLNMYEQGQIHWMDDVPLQNIDRLMGRPDFHLDTYLGTYYYQLNVTVAPLNDPRVRRALAMAIDRETLVRDVLRAGQRPAYHYVPPLWENYHSPDTLHFDAAGARRLLGEAGFPDGEGFPVLHLLYNTLEQHQTIAAYIQDQWRTNLGIDVQLENTEWNTYLERRNSMDYEMARAGWIGDYGDPMTFLDMWTTNGGNNNTGWSNARFDELIFGALREADPDRRRQMMMDAEAILMDELPILPLYFYVSKNIVKTNLEGFFGNPLDQHPLNGMRWAGGVPHD